jgi:ABC-type sugar transport system ATPase subunit
MEIGVEQLRFGRGNRSILQIDELRFAHGTTTALFGPNGSGKTTLLRLLAGLEQPTSGTVHRAPVSLAFQRPVFIRGTVRANLELGLALRKFSPPDIHQRVSEAARELDFEPLLDRSARTLSAGEAQRVNLARALCLRAPVTLLDEPLAGLDRVSRTRLLEELPHLLRTFATTTILVTHDREEAFRLADQIVVLAEGRVRAQGRSGDVYRLPPDALTAVLLGYMIVPVPNSLWAVPPGGLVLGNNGRTIPLVVERMVDMGNHRDVIGRVAGSRVTVRLPDGETAPPPGSTVNITVRTMVELSPDETATQR